MRPLIVLVTALATLAGCGVKGDLVRESGVEPPSVATSVIRSTTLEPTKPKGWLF